MISNAYAAPAGAQGDPTQTVIFFGIMIALFYFMLIRPQMKRAKEQKKMIDALQKGDEVITTGGVLGKITKVSDQYISLEIADNVVIQVQKATVQTLLPKGTMKSNA